MIKLCKIGIHDWELIQESPLSQAKIYGKNGQSLYINNENTIFRLKICRNCNKIHDMGVNWRILTDEFLENKKRENNLRKILK